jgi:hypothetical protein
LSVHQKEFANLLQNYNENHTQFLIQRLRSRSERLAPAIQ